MNILLLNHYAGSLSYGMEFRPYTFAREWVKAGHRVRIVAASFSHLRQKQPATNGTVTRELIDGIVYCWIKTPAYTGNYIRRALNIFIFVLRILLNMKKILKDFTPHIVVGSSTYPLDNVAGHFIARRCGALHVYEVHDLWPMSLIDLAGMSLRHPFVLLMQWAEGYAYETADRVISLLPYAEVYMMGRGLGRGKFFCVPNGIDLPEGRGTDAELPAEHASLLCRLREQKKFIVAYAGGHALSNALGSFIDAARHLDPQKVTFLLVGNGSDKEDLQARARSRHLSNVYFLPPISRAAVSKLLASVDVLFIGWQNKRIYHFGVSPNKLMDYMLSGKPILHANNVGNDIVAEAGCGISVPAEDDEAIARGVLRFMEMDERERMEMGARGRVYVQEHFRNTDLARKFIDSCNGHAEVLQ